MQMFIEANDDNALLDKEGMFFKEFPSDIRQVRYFTLLIVQKAPVVIREINLLEQQISELLKNAIKHGNHSNPEKKVSVWYTFSETTARIIIQDEGTGFDKLEEWNEFNRKRLEYFQAQDFEKMARYISYRTERSDDSDGGNALFAAVEYWDGGISFNTKRNCIAVQKNFHKKKPGM